MMIRAVHEDLIDWGPNRFPSRLSSEASEDSCKLERYLSGMGPY